MDRDAEAHRGEGVDVKGQQHVVRLPPERLEPFETVRITVIVSPRGMQPPPLVRLVRIAFPPRIARDLYVHDVRWDGWSLAETQEGSPASVPASDPARYRTGPWRATVFGLIQADTIFTRSPPVMEVSIVLENRGITEVTVEDVALIVEELAPEEAR